MPKKIDSELKARAVRLVTEHEREYASPTAAAAAVAKQLGLGRETVRRWVVRGRAWAAGLGISLVTTRPGWSVPEKVEA